MQIDPYPYIRQAPDYRKEISKNFKSLFKFSGDSDT
ncbi:hypothetical protein IMSAGC001_01382 [Bacteroides acidifaciens]|uniref:Uncharacterized protein n=1 Tax=Bacteroides acidifaciens TaxID=85831 RepID=A0A7J0A0U0_9BACE|nr:hypothetical protein IMSAGC001_01382 [Bacteroides acidifaciens]